MVTTLVSARSAGRARVCCRGTRPLYRPSRYVRKLGDSATAAQQGLTTRARTAPPEGPPRWVENMRLACETTIPVHHACAHNETVCVGGYLLAGREPTGI